MDFKVMFIASQLFLWRKLWQEGSLSAVSAGALAFELNICTAHRTFARRGSLGTWQSH
jgi:transposase-like protein